MTDFRVKSDDTPAKPCHGFTSEWVACQKRRYGSSPDHSRPPLYWLWTSNQRRERRESIERLVDLLPVEKRPGIISRLRTPVNFRQAINELLVGDSLRKPGHEVEFEPELENLTPDWRVRGPSGVVIVEVFSSFRSEVDERKDNGWDRLRLRLESIESNAFLSVHPDFNAEVWTNGIPPGEKEQKRIVREVQEWLRKEPAKESTIRIGGAEIQFWGRSDKTQHVSCSSSGLAFQVDTGAFRGSVGAKTSKYKALADRNKTPLVVSVVADFQTGREFCDLEDAILGTQRCRIARSSNGERAEHYRDDDGLFKEYPMLSAVTFASVDSGGIQHQLCISPSATYPLREAAHELFR
jgi:hypothetical protein